MAGSSTRWWAYLIGIIVGAALLGLAVFAVLVGLDVADQLSSVLSLAVALVTAGLTIVAWRRPPEQAPAPASSTTTYNIYRNKKVNIHPPP
ncbi:MAG: hypothetical protein QOH68_2562 [Nocardioidaceae bacterium]|jgi:hypothetical protein|nr:hypothetical protein [Nocardioidaceae bacterium]